MKTEPGRDPGMVERTRWLSVAFAASSIVLLVTLSWMIWADYARQWKTYQVRFNRIEAATTTEKIAQADQAVDATKRAELQARLATGQGEVAARRADIRAAQGVLDGLQAEWYAADQNYRFTKAKIDVARYDYDEAVHTGHGVAAAKRDLDELLDRWEQERLALEKVLAEKDAAQAKLDELRKTLSDAQKGLDELLGERNRLQERLAQITPAGFTSLSGLITWARNLPVVDMANPSLKIRQIMPADLYDDVNFTATPKVDRCTTCHLGIDKKDYQDAAQPFKTHPDVELYLQGPHPIERVGCTACHQGRGRATSFRQAAHTPSTKEQEHSWGAYTGTPEYAALHYWDLPMLAQGHTESQCAKCHSGVVEVPRAENLNTGRLLIERYGCFGCHKIKGWDHLRKVGPSLRKVASKTDGEWMYRWIKEPRAFRQTRMPQVWDVRVDETADQHARNDVEANAAVAYLLAKSERVSYPAAPAGDLEAGRRTFESVGCLGCHRVGDDRRGVDGPVYASYRTFGPNLDGTGTKVNAGWLYEWIRNPRGYWHETKMPRLRLTDREAANVTAYLMSLTHEEFRDRPRPELDGRLRDRMVEEYLLAQYTVAQSREKLDAMSDDERTQFLGERTIGRYGCFGCHEIAGFEDANPIGVELTEEGSKLVERLDFGFEHERLPHTLPAWLEQKLLEPRIFDRDKDKAPADLLRMPKFHLTGEEAGAIVTAILSFSKEKVPEAAQKLLSAEERHVEDGWRLVRDHNCRGCHELGGRGGAIRAVIEDQVVRSGGEAYQAAGLSPPMLHNAAAHVGEGSRVRTPWLHGFLKDPSNHIRPWLDVRMPTFDFSDEEANTLTRFFAALDGVPYPFQPEPGVADAETLAVGRKLFGLWQCERCHVVAGKLPNQDPANMAPDLANAHERLRADWIARWLADPGKVIPGTRMPANFPANAEENAYPEILGGDRDRQIEAVRTYLLSLTPSRRGAPAD